MDKQWYIQNGYKLSATIDDAELARAERDVTDAYYTPIAGAATVPQAVRERVIGNLAFLLLLQRSIFATRAGARTKTGYNSADADAWAILQQEAASCHLALEQLKAVSGTNPNAEVTDICKIYFRTNFLNM